MTDTGSRARVGWGLAGAVLFGAAVVAVVLFALGVVKRLVRATAPWLVELPGGGWTAGAVLGLLSVAGWAGGAWFSAPERSGGRTAAARTGRATGQATGYVVAAGVCWTAAFGALLYVLGSLPGRHCRSDTAMCAYIPGTGSALAAYVGTAAVVGGLWYRRRAGRAQARRAEERARLKRLRKKGKGKSRAARGE